MSMDSDFNKFYYDQGKLPATMGCRTYLMSNVNGEAGVEGRGNIAPVTINLPRIGIIASRSSESEEKVIEKFFEVLNKRLEQGRDSLMHRYSVLKNLKVSDLPFIAGQKLIVGSEELGESDNIEEILRQGSWGIGFIGLSETLVALVGENHAKSTRTRELGERIVQFIRDFTDRTTQELKLNFSCYATPAEGLSGKLIVQDKKMFGIIPGVTDKDYYTNSYHIPVGEIISITEKLKIEAPYHKMCNAGHISYIEFDGNPTGDTIEDVLRWAYTNTDISYLGMNFHIRYCKECGTYLYSGEQHCTSCNSTNIQGISRVTGYLSLDERFGPGKEAEKADRKDHNKEHRKTY